MKPDPSENAAEHTAEHAAATPPTTQWFFFHIEGLKPDMQYRFHIANFCKRKSLLAEGMRPVVCRDCSGELPPGPAPLWHRTGGSPAYRPTTELGVFPDEDCVGLYCYSFTLSTSSETENKLFVALSQPYSYTHLQKTLDALQKPHVRRECLCLTPEGRRIDLVVVTENGDELQDAVDSSTPPGASASKLLTLGEAEGAGNAGAVGEFVGADEPQHATTAPAFVRRQYKPVLFICARAAFRRCAFLVHCRRRHRVARIARRRGRHLATPLRDHGCSDA